MITKSEGAKDSCPSCRQELICRKVVSEKYGERLQWQYADREEAHFTFDFKTKKSSCKESSEAGSSQATSTSTQTDTLDISQIPLDDKQKADIFESAEDGANRMLVVLRAVQECCRKAGVTHPATVGMIFNQVCENRR